MTQGKGNTSDAIGPADPGAAAAPIVQPQNTPPVGSNSPTGIDPAAGRSYIASITENYAQYRATAQIPWGNAVAFNPGDAVNADHPALDQWVKDGLVEKIAGKSGRGK